MTIEKITVPDKRNGRDIKDINDFDLAGGTASDVMVEAVVDEDKEYLRSEIYDASQIDPYSIAQRDFVYGNLLLSGYITTLISPGGVGKSTLSLTMAISVALGRKLLDEYEVPKSRNVLLLNNEDDKDELSRRIAAICGFYGISLSELKGKLFVRSGYEKPVMVVSDNGHGAEEAEHFSHLVEFCQENEVGVIVADPYVSFHNLAENDNALQNLVVKGFRKLCHQTQASMLLVVHTRKGGGDSEAHAGDAEHLRGASSIKDGARIAFTTARMSSNTAKDLGIPKEIANSLVRIDDAKMNFSKMDAEAIWINMASYKLPNGDWVGVPQSFDITPHIQEDTEDAMTATRWAEFVHKSWADDLPQEQVQYTNLRSRVMKTSSLGRASCDDYLTLLSQNEKKPTTIRLNGTYWHYWINKESDKKTAPWMISRQEMN
jgi:hypothetical protein